MSFILYFLGIFSALSAFVLSFPFYSDVYLLLGSLLIICLFQYILYYVFENKKYFYIFSICVFLICLYLSWTGLLYMKDVILKKYMEVSSYQFYIMGTYHYNNDFFMNLTAMLLLVLPINVCNIYFLDKKKYILSILILFPFIFCEILFTITPPLYCLPYITYCIILVFLRHQSQIQLLPIILCISFILGLFYLNPPESYTHPREKQSYMDAAVSVPGQSNQSYNLMEQGNRYYSNRVDLVVRGVTNQSFLLRGNVYNDFDGEWKQSYSQYVKEYPFLDNIKKLSEHVQCQTQRITVSDNYHRDIVYVPYFYYPVSRTLSYFYSHFEGEKDEEYELILPNNEWNSYFTMTEDEKWQKFYNKINFYIRQGYTSTDNMRIPDGTRQVLSRFMEEHELNDITDIYELITKVKKAIHDNTEYSLTPGRTPDNENFFDYFLNKNKKGYCVHYASTLALILRMKGYEANFVTGYQVDKANSSLDYIRVYDSSAHAWVEIADDLLGVIPIEATPASSNAVTANQSDNPQSSTPLTQSADNTIDNSPASQEKEDDKVFVVSTYVYVFIGVMIVIVGVYGQSRIRLRSRWNQLDYNQRVCMMYHCLDRLKVHIPVEIIHVVKKAKFSQYQLNDEEYQKALSIYTKLISEVYKDSSIIRKIKLKVIDAYI